MSRRRGFTLVEMLVAMSVFLVLGLAMTVLLRQSLAVWRRAEQQRRMTETATNLLSMLEDDLQAVYARQNPNSPNPDIRFIADLVYGPSGEFVHTRLRFVRTLPGGEERHPLASRAGELPLSVGAGEYLTLHADALKQTEDAPPWSMLRPTGDLAEVIYTCGPEEGSTRLWRGFRAPIGDFAGAMPDFPVTPSFFRFADHVSETGGTLPFDQVFHAIAEGVLCVCAQFRYDGDRAKAGWYSLSEHPDVKNGVWDSRDLGWPRALRLVIVLEALTIASRETFLSEDFTAGSTAVTIEDATGFPSASARAPVRFRVEGEWCAYSTRAGRRLSGVQRGLCGTSAIDHDQGAPTSLPGERDAEFRTRLSAALGAGETRHARLSDASGLPLAGAEGAYVLIDDEWVGYLDRQDDELRDLHRGALGSTPASHKRGAEVRFGRAYTRILPLPGAAR